MSKAKSIAAVLTAGCLGLAAFAAFGIARAAADEDPFAERDVRMEYAADYTDSYRNRLQYSPARGWNNDPNGLLYVDGVYHMYYQYTWRQSDATTSIGWNDMSWGHATSSDLVHWTEHTTTVNVGGIDKLAPEVSIPAYQTDEFGNYYAMMFSGSAVYDEYNTSGFFDVDVDGKVVAGQGIVAMLTQPRFDKTVGWDAQRQIVAYSKDGGDTFTIYGEVLAGRPNGNGGYEDFRDPKVFWSEEHEKWLCAVGGGKVRMYASDDLKEWDFLGETGFWGECPDISKFETEVDGATVTKYVLIMSPEDKTESHEINGTTIADTYYPAEYYVVGSLDADGLFVAEGPLTRLSEGLDSYAFQSFNSAPDGKVYGVSWSASWKNVGDYRHLHKNYNGGMTVVCELGLTATDEGYVLTRKPVDGFADMRGDKFIDFDGALAAGDNAFAGATADVADFEIDIDLSDSDATKVEIGLRESAFERTSLVYDVATGELTLDRGESSLIARDTYLYNMPSEKTVALAGGKLKLRILLDRAFVSVFAGDGEASYFNAIFPSAQSNGLSFTADGDVKVKAQAYRMGNFLESDEKMSSCDDFFVSTNLRNEAFYVHPENIIGSLDMTVGSVAPVAAYSYAPDFDPADISFRVVNGDSVDVAVGTDGVATLTAVRAGDTKIEATYRGQSKTFVVAVNENGYDGPIFKYADGGTSAVKGDGLHLKRDDGDGFRFADLAATDFIYKATIKRATANAQACGLVFGVSENLRSYYVVTADFVDGKIKLWQAGIGDLAVTDHDFDGAQEITLTIVATAGNIAAYIDADKEPTLEYRIDGFAGGYIGINVYRADMAFSGVEFTNINIGENAYDFGPLGVVEVLNADENRLLTTDDYSLVGGVITLTPEYLRSLDVNREYTLYVSTEYGEFEVSFRTADIDIRISLAQSIYYEAADIAVTLPQGLTVKKLLVDGKSVEYAESDGKLTIAAAVFDGMRFGTHTVRVYCGDGRMTAVFTYADKKATEVPDPVEPKEPVNYTFLIIDLCIFGAIILAYLIFSYISRRKSRKA